MTFHVYTSPNDSVYFFAPPTATTATASAAAPPQPQPYITPGASVCRLHGYTGPVLQVAYGEVMDAGDDGDEGRPPRRLAWGVTLRGNSSSSGGGGGSSSSGSDGGGGSSDAIRFEIRALAAPGPFKDVTLSFSLPPAAFAAAGGGGGEKGKGAPRFVVVENGVVPIERGGSSVDSGNSSDVSLGESFFPFVSRASLVAAAEGGDSGARRRRRRLRGAGAVMLGEGEEGDGALAAFHLVGHSPHAVASLGPGRMEVALHRRVPVRVFAWWGVGCLGMWLIECNTIRWWIDRPTDSPT
jgi:hypothetical protein